MKKYFNKLATKVVATAVVAVIFGGFLLPTTSAAAETHEYVRAEYTCEVVQAIQPLWEDDERPVDLSC